MAANRLPKGCVWGLVGFAAYLLFTYMAGCWLMFSDYSQKSNLQKLLREGDQKWNEQDQFAAIAFYKQFLQRKDEVFGSYKWEEDYPRLYRRVIEHEAKYGDPGEAVDWIVKARNDRFVGDRLTLLSPEAKSLWEEVQQSESR